MSETKSNFTSLPHLIEDLDLDVYQFRVYAAIKRATGENGICTKSISTLAKQTKLSTRKVQSTIAELCEINPIIKKPLIKKTTRKSEHGDSDTNIITVTDVWKDNSNHFKESSGGAQYAGGGAYGAGGVVHAMQGGGAPCAPKEEPFKKNPFKKNLPPPQTPPPKKEEEDEEFGRCLKLIESIKQNYADREVPIKYSFTDHGVYRACKDTSGDAVAEAANVYARKKPSQHNLDNPDLWLLREAERVQKIINQKELHEANSTP